MQKTPQKQYTRRAIAATLLGAAFAILSGCSNTTQGTAQSSASPPTSDSKGVIRIGYQKGGPTNIMRLRGTLEPLFKPQNVRVEYVGFAAGPQLLEAMSIGSVDFGSTGESPAIFAQAAGAQIVYVANAPPGGDGRGQAIIVPRDSPIKTLADLKGKRVAFQKASTSHNFVAQILERDGIPYKDIKPVYLAPPDARMAFESGKVDAWAIWDPFLAIAQGQTQARTLVDGKGVFAPGGFYLASRKFATEHPDWVGIALQGINETSQWSWENPKEAAVILSKSLGVSSDLLEAIQRRSGSGPVLVPVGEEMLKAQQQVADSFHRIGMLPKRIDVREATLPADQYAPIAASLRTKVGTASTKSGGI